MSRLSFWDKGWAPFYLCFITVCQSDGCLVWHSLQRCTCDVCERRQKSTKWRWQLCDPLEHWPRALFDGSVRHKGSVVRYFIWNLIGPVLQQSTGQQGFKLEVLFVPLLSCNNNNNNYNMKGSVMVSFTKPIYITRISLSCWNSGILTIPRLLWWSSC